MTDEREIIESLYYEAIAEANWSVSRLASDALAGDRLAWRQAVETWTLWRSVEQEEAK